MNFLDARVMGQEGEAAVVEVAGLGKRRLAEARMPGRLGCVAIRPEKFALHGADPGGGAVGGVVESRVYLGERSNLHVRVEGAARPVLVSVPNATLGGAGLAGEGSRVWLSWDDAALIPLSDG
jgi:ABC-type Fe3+/spermidine/putrescine transport system ATPase subunit